MSFAITKNFIDDKSLLHPEDAVAAIIRNENGEFLLQLRDDKEGIFFPNHWGLFGGAIDNNEVPSLALQRELEEELCIKVPNDSFYEFSRTDLGFSYNKCLIRRYFFVVDLVGSLSSKIRVTEGREARFFDIEKCFTIPNFTPYDRFALWAYINKDKII